MRYLGHDRDGGAVLAPEYLGLLTPGLTGRHVYLGACQWSEPDCSGRATLIYTVFDSPTVSAAAVRAAVLSTDARFVFNSTCSLRGKDLDAALRPLATSIARFGCATVYEVSRMR